MASAVLMLPLAAPSPAAQFFWIPALEASTEYHSNANLAPSDVPHSSSEAFVGDLSTIFGWRTPISETQLRPRLVLQHYTGLSNLRNNEEELDFKTRRTTERTLFDLFATVQRADSYSTEVLPAQYNPFDPNNPVVASSGLQRVGNTVQREQVRPLGELKLNQLNGIGFNGVFVRTNYSSTFVGSQEDFNYDYLRPYFKHTLTQQTDFVAGPFYAHYDASADIGTTSRSNLYGVSTDINHIWSPTTKGTLTAQVARSKSTTLQPVFVEDSTTSWTLLANLDRREQTSHLRLTVGHDVSPSSQGSLAQTDQLRIQYNKYFTARFSALVAARLVHARSSATTGTSVVDDKYGRGSFQLFYDMTREWFVWGGYTLTTQTQSSIPNTHDNSVLIGIGYQGIGPDRLLRLE